MTVIFLGSRNFTLINSEYFDSGDVVIAMALQNQPKSFSARDASFDNLVISVKKPDLIKRPDIKVSMVKVPRKVKKGSTVKIIATVGNAGKAKISNSKVNFYISPNNSKSIDDNIDTLIGTESVKLTMKKNGSTVFTKGRAALKWNVSENPSKYSIKAFCDSEDEIKESNEENNIGVSKKIEIR